MKIHNSNTIGLSENRFHNLFWALRCGGIPVKLQEKRTAYTIYYIVAIPCMYAMIIAMFMESVSNIDDLKYTMITLRGMFAVSSIVWTQIYVRFRMKTLHRLIDLTENFTWDELPIKEPDTGYYTMAGYIPRIQIAVKYSVIIVTSFHVSQSTIRMITNHAMVFNTWYPFDSSRSPVYEIINISQFLGTFLLISMMMGFMGLYATLVCVACSQLEKLRANLLNIRHKDVTSGQELVSEPEQEERLTQSSKEVFNHMQKQLNECISHHQLIIKFMDALEEGFSPGICVLFLILLAALCVDIFSAVPSWGDHTDLSQVVAAYVTLMSNVLIICWFGTRLTEEAEKVRDAAFGSNWVGTPVSFQRCIVFIIAIANKEFTLTAGKFVPVTNTTMMSMVNETMSFFMFLLHVMKKNEQIAEVKL